MKRILPFLLILVMLLSACAPAQETPAPEENPPASDVGGEQGGEETPDPEPEPDPEPVLPYQNPLNGTALAEPYLGRPVAVMLNNIKAAMPQHGVSAADIVYEVLAEGGVTRCMGIYSDVSNVGSIGSIRSARKYYVQLAQGYNALYLHFGGSDEALSYMRSIGMDDIDGGNGGSCFFQDQSRINAGYAGHHCWFATGSKILPYAQSLNRQISYEEEKSYGMAFDDSLVHVGTAVNKVSVHFNWSSNPDGKSTTLTYDEATKTYFAFQAGNTHGSGSAYMDGNTGKQVAFRNVLVLRAPSSIQSGSTLVTVETVGSGTGYYLCNGQMMPIKWSRASATDPFTYTFENGIPVTFGVGTTYIGIVPTAAAVIFE